MSLSFTLRKFILAKREKKCVHLPQENKEPTMDTKEVCVSMFVQRGEIRVSTLEEGDE